MDADDSARPFRFNFDEPEATGPIASTAVPAQDAPQQNFDKQNPLPRDDEEREALLPPPREVFALHEVEAVKPFITDPVVFQGGFTLLRGRVSTSKVIGLGKTDLLPGKYEGGLKLWECTIDLINTIRREMKDGQLSFRGKRVLELGCGHGLPGVFAILKGASAVHFQDFNAEVLRNLTIPNVVANIENARSRSNVGDGASSKTRQFTSDVQYYAGDWGDVCKLLSNLEEDTLGDSSGNDALQVSSNESKEQSSMQDKLSSRDRLERASHEGRGGYDIILMSETVYSLPSLQKLYDVIKKCLRPRYGVLYVAAKKHYFGVGGGTRQFKAVVDQDGILGGHLVTDFADGSSNIREIWKYFFR